MPTYEYECPKGHLFELFQKMSDPPTAKCPKCGAKAKRKISRGAGFLLKGEGFYSTDYRSEDYKKAASADVPGAMYDAKTAGKEMGDKAPTESGAGEAPGGTKGEKKEGGAKEAKPTKAKETKKASGARSRGGKS